MADESNLSDYTGEFRKKSGHLEDFSREFLVKLTHIYEDTMLFACHAWATVLSDKVGPRVAWDLAGEISRSMGVADFYPFVLSRPAVRKLHLVHRVIAHQTPRGGRRRRPPTPPPQS